MKRWIFLVCFLAGGCVPPEISRTAALSDGALRAFTVTREKILPVIKGEPVADRQKLYSAAMVQIFLCKQTTREALDKLAQSVYAGEAARGEARSMSLDAAALCSWTPPPVTP